MCTCVLSCVLIAIYLSMQGPEQQQHQHIGLVHLQQHDSTSHSVSCHDLQPHDIYISQGVLQTSIFDFSFTSSLRLHISSSVSTLCLISITTVTFFFFFTLLKFSKSSVFTRYGINTLDFWDIQGKIFCPGFIFCNPILSQWLPGSTQDIDCHPPDSISGTFPKLNSLLNPHT